MLGRDDEVVLLRDEHLHCVRSVSEIVLARVQGLLLDNLIHRLLLHRPVALGCVAAVALLTVEGDTGRMTRLLALDYEVGPLAHGTASVNHVALQERVLADVLQDLASLVLLRLPLLNVVACRLVLEALQDRLVLTSNLY